MEKCIIIGSVRYGVPTIENLHFMHKLCLMSLLATLGLKEAKRQVALNQPMNWSYANVSGVANVAVGVNVMIGPDDE